jgi:VWFA-related protein
MHGVFRLTLAVVLLAGAAAAQQAPTFQSVTRTVVLHATVRHADGRLVPDLPREAFTVYDNGKPADITVFSNEPQAMTVALLIDMSGSMERHFLRVRGAIREFIQALHPDDRVRIGTFGTEVALSPHLTGDKAVLTRVLEEETWPGGATPMWSAAFQAMGSLADEPGRRVILILTDGKDGAPGTQHTAVEVQSRAMADGFMVYGIGMEETGLDPTVMMLAEDSGGGYFDLKPGDDLTSIFARVVEELRHQYVVGFTPAALDGRRHRVDVKLSSPQLKARARRSYVAAPEAIRK